MIFHIFLKKFWEALISDQPFNNSSFFGYKTLYNGFYKLDKKNYHASFRNMKKLIKIMLVFGQKEEAKKLLEK